VLLFVEFGLDAHMGEAVQIPFQSSGRFLVGKLGGIGTVKDFARLDLPLTLEAIAELVGNTEDLQRTGLSSKKGRIIVGG
jgi:hypothetical protein